MNDMQVKASGSQPLTDSALLQDLMGAYGEFNQSSVQRLLGLYRDDVLFIDPVTQIKGKEALREYFLEMAAGLNQCHFDFESVISQSHLPDNFDTSLFWTMRFSHPKLASGELISVKGCSHLRHTSQQIIFHRDYYDLGEMLYEQVPVVGSLVRYIKNRLEP